MSPRGTIPSIAAALLLVACDAPSGAAVGEEASSPWIEVGALRFAADGESDVVTIPAQAASAAIALRVTSDPGVCFQLSEAIDGEGGAVVEARSAGPFCRECELRTSIAVSAGVFVLPTLPGRFKPETGVALRFAQVACETLTPLARPEERPPLRIEFQPIAAVPERATLHLRFLVDESSILFGDPVRQAALIDALAEELGDVGIEPRLIASQGLDELPAELRFHAGDHDDLAGVIAAAPAGDDADLDVVFGGCLRYDDPIFGPPSPVHGFTPRIPGGAGPADGVFMPGLDCFAAGARPIDLPVPVQARILAHEIGHHLGLFHSVEQDGRADALDDTDADNLMHWNPALATAIGLSSSQGRVMRMHLALRGGAR